MTGKTGEKPNSKAEENAKQVVAIIDTTARGVALEGVKVALDGAEHGARTAIASGAGVKEVVSKLGNGAKAALSDPDKLINAGRGVAGDIAFDLAYQAVSDAIIPDDLKKKKEDNKKELEERSDRGELGAKASLFFRGFAAVVPGGGQIIDGIDNIKAANDLNIDASIKVSENDAAITAPLTKAEFAAGQRMESERKAKLAAAQEQVAPNDMRSKISAYRELRESVSQTPSPEPQKPFAKC